MALHTLTDDGHLKWICHHCSGKRVAHVSHERVEYANADHTLVALPPCDCGSRTFLRVAFTEQELAANNIIDEEGNPTESHAIAHRHMALARQMQTIGKVYTPPVQPNDVAPPTYTQAQVEEIITKVLQEKGLITTPRLPVVQPPNESKDA